MAYKYVCSIRSLLFAIRVVGLVRRAFFCVLIPSLVVDSFWWVFRSNNSIFYGSAQFLIYLVFFSTAWMGRKLWNLQSKLCVVRMGVRSVKPTRNNNDEYWLLVVFSIDIQQCEILRIISVTSMSIKLMIRCIWCVNSETHQYLVIFHSDWI